MFIDAYESPEAEDLLRSAQERYERMRRSMREIATEAAAAGLFLAAAVVIALAVHPARQLSMTAVAVTMAGYLLAARVVFPVGSGWTRPTQVVFVPMLFLLPINLVALLTMGYLLVDLLFDVPRRRVSFGSVCGRIADASYALGPVLVLVAFSAERFTWSDWWIYVLAFAAQAAVDLIAGVSRTWFAEGILPRRHMLMAWLYVIDACLSCAGLLAAASTTHRPALILLVLPLIALLGLFARERTERMENTLALSTAYRGTALLLGDVIEEDDEYTGIHSRAVVDLAVEVADRLGLDAVSRRNVEFGALLHDVGKIRIPKEIIRKQGRLSDAEWAVMREHTIFGEQMLQKVGGTLSSVGRVVRHSHERYDGTGYPDGLVGEQIPIEARIVCACDAFNAMTTTRAYRLARSVPEAIGELRRCSGTHFDPAVVRALLEILEPGAPRSGRDRAQLWQQRV